MSKNAIVTGGEKKDVCAMAVLAMNIAEVCPDVADELVIYHDGISEKDKTLINNIFPTRFIDFHFPIKFWDKVLNASLRGFTDMVFYKYEFLNLIKEYDRVIIIDYDVIIQKDISELKNLTGLNILQGGELKKKLCRPIPSQICSQYELDQLTIWAPLIVVGNDWKTREELDELYKQCVDLTSKYARNIKSPEECVLSMVIQDNHLDYKLIDGSVLTNHRMGTAPDVAILHAVGRPKYWDGLYNEVWDTRYQKWIKLGGSRYREPLKRRLIRYTYEISIRNFLKRRSII